jgi:hypothetical protein
MKTSSSANGSGENLSGSVCLHKGTTLKWMMLILVQMLIKHLKAPVALIVTHTLYNVYMS